MESRHSARREQQLDIERTEERDQREVPSAGGYERACGGHRLALQPGAAEPDDGAVGDLFGDLFQRDGRNGDGALLRGTTKRLVE